MSVVQVVAFPHLGPPGAGSTVLRASFHVCLSASGPSRGTICSRGANSPSSLRARWALKQTNSVQAQIPRVAPSWVRQSLSMCSGDLYLRPSSRGDSGRPFPVPGTFRGDHAIPQLTSFSTQRHAKRSRARSVAASSAALVFGRYSGCKSVDIRAVPTMRRSLVSSLPTRQTRQF